MSMRHLPRYLLALALGPLAALLVSCGQSGRGLIPAIAAGPLQSDFEAVANAARAGNGDCTATKEALSRTERDFRALPRSVDHGLRDRLKEGIANLRGQSLSLCEQPLAQTTTATTTTSTQTTPTNTQTTTTTPTTTTTTPTSTQTTPTNTQTTPPPGGGTQGPGEGSQGSGGEKETPPGGSGQPSESGSSGGTGQGASQ